MTLTEMSMLEAFFFPVMQAKTKCSVPACEAFPSEKKKNTARNVHEEKYGVRRRVKQLTAKQQTTRGHRCWKWNMFKMESMVKRGKKKKGLRVFRERMWHLNKRGEKVCSPARCRWLGCTNTREEHLPSDCGKTCALTGLPRGWLRIIHFSFSTDLLLIIYSSR